MDVAAIAGAAVIGGAARGYLATTTYEKYANLAMLGMVGLGGYLATQKRGLLQALGLGVAAAGAACFGTKIPAMITQGSTTQYAVGGGARPLALGAGQGMGMGARSYAGARQGVGWTPQVIR
jgi:hypothetical protein